MSQISWVLFSNVKILFSIFEVYKLINLSHWGLWKLQDHEVVNSYKCNWLGMHNEAYHENDYNCTVNVHA